MDLPVMQDI
ncbi:hypothetical protein A2U01_0076278, partial [Trifolium medium]|nr:hypothetical protein [Trifolium medium]